MAKVNLTGVWINLVDQPADRLVLHKVSQFTRNQEKPGRILRGAGGRVRVVTRAGTARSWSLRFRFLTQAQVAWLEERAGRVVCVRDGRGHRLFGTYLHVAATELAYVKLADVASVKLADVSLTFTEVTFSEAV